MSWPRPFPPLALVARGLCCRRGGERVLDGLDLDLRGGEALVLAGPNGAGKSTALLALMGELTLESGTLEWAGDDGEIGRFHFIGHLPAVKPGLTVAENLDFWIAAFGEAPGRRDDALRAAGLGGLGDVEAGLLSAGQTRRLALARLVAIRRPVWLLDEPTAALDAAGAAWVAALLKSHLADGGMAVVSTHLPLGIEEETGAKTLLLGS